MEKTRTMEHAAEPEAPKGALLTIFGVVLVDMLGFGLVIPLLPFYAEQFKASELGVGLIFAIFSLCQFFATPILGAWSDRVGRRRVLLISQTGNALSYLLLAWSTQHHWNSLSVGLGMLYLSRVVAGLTSGNISAAQAYISDVTTPENRTKGMGVLGAAFGFGFALGPALGGMLAHYVHMSAPAWAAAGLSMAAAVLCITFLKEGKRRVSSDAGNYFHPRRFAPLIANKPLLKINAMWFISMVAFVSGDAMIVLFLNRSMGYSQREVAWYLLLVGVVILITQGRLVGMLQKHFSEWGLCISGILIAGVGSLLTAGVAWTHSLSLLIVSAIVVAFGRSLLMPTISALVSQHSDPELQGTSFGFFQGVGTLARVVGPVMAGPLLAWHLSYPWLMATGLLWITGLWLGIVHMQESRAVAEATSYTSEN